MISRSDKSDHGPNVFDLFNTPLLVVGPSGRRISDRVGDPIEQFERTDAHAGYAESPFLYSQRPSYRTRGLSILKRPNAPIDPSLRHAANACEVCENHRKPVCVAIVDDDAAIREMITGYLSEHGITPVATSGWPEMSGCMAAAEIDLVILDLRLGREDGFDVLREIRSYSDIPVIITSGHRRDEIDRVIGLELGADDYLTKPFGLRELLARIRAVLRRKEAEPEDSDVRRDKYGI